MSGVKKDRHSVGSAEWVTQLVYELLHTDSQWPWVRDVFPDAVIVAFDGDTRLFSYPWSIVDGSLALGTPTQVTVEYVTKRRATQGSPELTGPIVRKDAKRQVAYAAVLVPGEPDSDGEVLTAEKIEAVAHGWLEDFRALDADHSLKTIDAVPVESYIVPEDITFGDYELPAGTWVLATKIRDDAVWKRVEKGELTGYSIMGVARADLAQALAASKSGGAGAAFKRTLLADLGEDWVTPLVSIVDAPAVPKAKFFALKSEAPTTPETLFSRFKSWWLAQEPVERGESSQKGNAEMTPEEMTAAITAAMEPFAARLAALEAPAATAEADAPESADDDVATLKSELASLKAANAEHEAFRKQVAERLKAAPKSLIGQDGGDAPKPAPTEFDEYTDVTGVKYRRDATGRARPVA